MKNGCIFCQIASDSSAAKVFYQDDMVIAFQDIHPIAPVHTLIIPRKHIESVNELNETDEQLIGHMVIVARQLAKEQNIHNSGYRLVINTGPQAGQSVFHVHLHLLGGRHLPFHFT